MFLRFYQNGYRAGFLVFGVLLIHAVVFYKERMVMPDAAIYLFQMVSWHDFTIIHHRFIAVLTEWIPLLAIKMGKSLPHIALVYSLAFPIYYLGCYLCCGWVFKNKPIALALLLYLILFSTHTNYWIVSELGLGLGLLCVSLTAVLYNYCNKWLAAGAYLVAAIMLVFVAFAHPLLHFAILFTVVFLWRDKPHRNMLLAWGAVYLLAAAYKFVYYKESYETSSMDGVRNFISFFPNYFDLYSNKRFLANCLGKYWAIPLSFLSITAVYAYHRQWFRLTFFVSFFLGFLLLVNVSFPYGYILEMYMENLYLLLGWFIALPLVFDVFPVFLRTRIAFPAFLILVVFCLLRIWSMHQFYTGRLNWERSLVKKSYGQKWILESGNLPQDTMLYNWCIPYEIWLLSTIENQHTASIVVHESPGLMPGEASLDPRKFMATWEEYPYANLPPPYFLFHDTVSTYRHIWEKIDLTNGSPR